MEALIMAIGPKLCCIMASGCGGIANVLTLKKWNWGGIKDVVLAIIVGVIAAEFFIPPLMKMWTLDMIWGPAIAFVVGYCGIRLLPAIEDRVRKLIKSG